MYLLHYLQYYRYFFTLVTYRLYEGFFLVQYRINSYRNCLIANFGDTSFKARQQDPEIQAQTSGISLHCYLLHL